jgi:hypothetical protein
MNNKRFMYSTRLLNRLRIIGLCASCGVIISATQISVHLTKISVIPDMGVFSLFVVPLMCSFVTIYLTEIQDMKLAIYLSFVISAFSILFMITVFYSPMFMRIADPMGLFTLWMMKKVFISFIFMFPAILVGCVVGMLVYE